MRVLGDGRDPPCQRVERLVVVDDEVFGLDRVVVEQRIARVGRRLEQAEREQQEQSPHVHARSLRCPASPNT